MKTFDDIYNSIKPDCTSQPRNAIDIRIILLKAYILLKAEQYDEYSPFDIKGSAFDTDRTTIERLLKELSTIKTDDVIYTMQSQGIEEAIFDIKTIEIYTINPSIDSSNPKWDNVGKLKGNLLYLIDVARDLLILTRKKIIRDRIAQLNSKDEKLNYLNSTLIEIKQNKGFWDKAQYNLLINFIELELNKWDKYIEIKDTENRFSSPQELHKFVVNLIRDKLEHDIRVQEGYRVFWRDKHCTKEKNENEIHPFIKSILKPYCDERNVKITRESAVANGHIDMAFTYLNFNICLEVKKAHHQDVTGAINTQLTKYMIGEKTDFGIYLILWYKSLEGFKQPKKYQDINQIITDIKIQKDNFTYEIIGIDCSKPISPSKK
jgi:hypothetical protein